MKVWMLVGAAASALWIPTTLAQETPETPPGWQPPPAATGDEPPDAPGSNDPSQPGAPGVPGATEPPPPSIDPTRMSIDELLNQAERYKDEGRFKATELFLREIYRREPGNLAAKVISGEMFEATGDAYNARLAYTEVLNRQPTDFRANFGLGRLYNAVRKWTLAVHYLTQAESVAPAEKVGRVRSQLVYALRGIGSPGKAVETAEKAVAAAPNDLEARRSLITVRIDANDYERALLESQTMVNLARAEASASPGNRMALQRLFQANEIHIEVLHGYQASLMIKRADGRATGQVIPGAELKVANTLQRLIETMFAQTELQRSLAHHDILSFAQNAVQVMPTHVENQIALGVLQRLTADEKAARATFEKVLEIDPSNAEARRQLDMLSNAEPAEQAMNPAAGTP